MEEERYKAKYKDLKESYFKTCEELSFYKNSFVTSQEENLRLKHDKKILIILVSILLFVCFVLITKFKFF